MKGSKAGPVVLVIALVLVLSVLAVLLVKPDLLKFGQKAAVTAVATRAPAAKEAKPEAKPQKTPEAAEKPEAAAKPASEVTPEARPAKPAKPAAKPTAEAKSEEKPLAKATPKAAPATRPSPKPTARPAAAPTVAPAAKTAGPPAKVTPAATPITARPGAARVDESIRSVRRAAYLCMLALAVATPETEKQKKGAKETEVAVQPFPYRSFRESPFSEARVTRVRTTPTPVVRTPRAVGTPLPGETPGPPVVGTPGITPPISTPAPVPTFNYGQFRVLGQHSVSRRPAPERQQLTALGTVVGPDGRSVAILSDGTSRFFAREGQTVTAFGRRMQVKLVDRGSVIIEDQQQRVMLEIGGASQ